MKDSKKKSVPKKESIFQYLKPNEKDRVQSIGINHKFLDHPDVIKLGYQFRDHTFKGSRALVFLSVLQKYLSDNEYDGKNPITVNVFDQVIGFLNRCRPMSVGMRNLLHDLKCYIQNISDPEKDQNVVKRNILNYIDDLINSIDIEVIVKEGAKLLGPQDVVLTYGHSPLVEQIILEAWKNMTTSSSLKVKFKVIVAHAAPFHEGKQLIQNLASEGIKCESISINGLGNLFYTHKVTKCMLGAHGMLINGSLIARVGTAVVAMMCNENNVPVIVPCESYKFSSKTAVDSITNNEWGPPEQWVGEDDYSQLKKKKNLDLFYIQYDTTPSDQIQMVLTEKGKIPATSIPVILRELKSFDGEQLLR